MPIIDTKKLHIGIVLPQTKNGGYFQLSLSIADALLKYSREYAYTILYYDKEMLGWLMNLGPDIPLVHIPSRSLLSKFNTLINIVFQWKALPMSLEKRSAEIKKAGLDLLVLPFAGMIGFTENIPYIVSISSIEYPYYPELTTLRERVDEQFMGTNAARYSVISVVDSNRGVDDLHKFYHIPIDKIRVIPHKVPGYIYGNHDMSAETAKEILSRFALPERYLFYPSQFEHAKNHRRLLQALSKVETQHGIRVPLILVGLKGGSYKEIMTLISEYRMADQVVHLGFASDKELVAFYKLATALVYVSLGGPTNLPPLEAMILGTPVLCSNLFSMPEQVGDAALLFDPFSPDDIAAKIFMIWTDDDLKRRLRENGSRKRKELTQENYARQWERVIGNALRYIGKA